MSNFPLQLRFPNWTSPSERNHDFFLLWRCISAGDALQAILIWLKSLSLITWDINPCIASMVVLQLKNKHKFNVGQTLNWTVILFEDIQLFWKFRVPITPWILTTVQKGKVTHSSLAIVANSFLLLQKQTDEHYTHKDQFQKTSLSGNLWHLTLTTASELCGHLNQKVKKKNKQPWGNGATSCYQYLKALTVLCLTSFAQP